MHVRICPQCRSYDVHRSRRRGFVERVLLPLVLKRPYRCDGCNSRYYGYTFAQPLPDPEPSSQKKSDATSES
ncbi:MAG: hypothetical protein ACRD2Q_01045 [Terriglobales bacterium]